MDSAQLRQLFKQVTDRFKEVADELKREKTDGPNERVPEYVAKFKRLRKKVDPRNRLPDDYVVHLFLLELRQKVATYAAMKDFRLIEVAEQIGAGKFYMKNKALNIQQQQTIYKEIQQKIKINVREEEIKNFNKVLNEALDAIPIDDVARLTKLCEFGSGEVLNRTWAVAVYIHVTPYVDSTKNVEVPWVVDASKNFETLKNEVYKLAMSAIEEEKPMWETVESELQKIKIADLGYDHPLYDPEKLKKITNEMLLVLRRVWESPKWKAYIETEAVINEGSYICEVISPLLNIIVSDLSVDTDIWGVWAEQASSASAQRKGSYKSARQPNFMVIAQINNKEIEVGYLETGRPNSSSDKQLQDHKKLNRLAKDAIDTTTNSKKDRVFRGLAVKKMLAIFTINVAGDLLEIRCMCKEGGLYKSCLLEDAKIPLHIPSKIDDVYQFIHALLTFRTAIACTLRNILHTTDDFAEMMSMSSDMAGMTDMTDMTDITDRTNVSDITTSSQTSIVTVNSLPRSTSTSSSHVPKKRKSMHFKKSAKIDSQTTIASLRELNSRLSVEITEFRKKYAKIEAENIKLKQIIEENTEFKTRFEEQDRKNKIDIANLINENTEHKSRVSKLEQRLSQNDEEKDDLIAKLDDDTASYKTNSDDTPEQIKNISDNISNSDIYRESNIQYSEPLIRREKRSREYFSNDDGIQDDQNSIPDISNDLLLQISSSVPMLALAQLFDKATVAEYTMVKLARKEPEV
ncbi:hypothetical protein C2G38_2221399 [Gigaspora rosea]|uniref:Uncharacterized protein n=1 Tax=Gigaspora rosea TaxID=44941 RepID=A0A397U569_9GLOM|nr:hypothetical protein C2G38_2221399 [Gigaspora rosea]